MAMTHSTGKTTAFVLFALSMTAPAQALSAEDRKEDADVSTAIDLADPVVVARSAPDEQRWGVHQFPALSRLPDGSILIMYADAKDASETHGREAPAFVSHDEGRSWTPYQGDLRVVRPHFAVSEVFDGEHLVAPSMPYFDVTAHDVDLPEPIAVFDTYGKRYFYAIEDFPEQVHSHFAQLQAQRYDPDSGRWEAERIRYDVEDRILWRSGDSDLLPQTFFERPLLKHDGELFYADYRAQYRLPDGSPPKKMSTVCMVSRDNGRSFTRRSTIATDPQGDNLKGEPQLTVTADGRLACLLRQTDQAQKALQICWSSDKGASWTEPVDIAERGVWPTVLLLHNQTMVLSYGRPGVYLRISHDGNGEEWNDPLSIIEGDENDRHGQTCGYTSLLALDADRFLIAYSDFAHQGPDQQTHKAILVRSITVRRP